jgi:hypothetical protein
MVMNSKWDYEFWADNIKRDHIKPIPLLCVIFVTSKCFFGSESHFAETEIAEISVSVEILMLVVH